MKLVEFYQRYLNQVMLSPSGHTQWLLPILIKFTEDEMILEYVVREDMVNAAGFLHGGVQASMVDESIGTLVNLTSPEFFFVSINMHTDYLNKARIGDVLWAHSQIVRRGKSVINVNAKLIHKDSQVVVSQTTSNLGAIKQASFSKMVDQGLIDLTKLK